MKKYVTIPFEDYESLIKENESLIKENESLIKENESLIKENEKLKKLFNDGIIVINNLSFFDKLIVLFFNKL
jgi:regulator of replication initiation timing